MPNIYLNEQQLDLMIDLMEGVTVRPPEGSDVSAFIWVNVMLEILSKMQYQKEKALA